MEECLADDAARWAAFPVAKRWHYLDTANWGFPPRSAYRFVLDYVRQLDLEGGLQTSGREYVDLVREELAVLLSVKADELCFVKNTSEGVNVVVAGLLLKPGDNVVIAESEHPAVRMPFENLKKKGVTVRLVRQNGDQPDPADYEALIDGNTRAIAASWIQYTNGAKLDTRKLATICQSHSILFLLDVIQGIGAINTCVAELGADVVTAGCHKHLLGGLAGTGIMWMRAETSERLGLTFCGLHSLTNSGMVVDLSLTKKCVGKFEYGSQSNLGLALLRGSVAFLKRVGLERIEAHVESLATAAMREGERRGLTPLTPIEKKNRGPIVAFELPDATRDWAARFKKAGVILTCRDTSARLSFGIINQRVDLEAFFQAMEYLPCRD